MSQRDKAQRLRELHRPGDPLVLVNAWDALSARMIEEAGAEAIATTSAGTAFALGYPDGQRISRDEMLAAVAVVARSVDLPVTADMEAGYGDLPDDAAATARGVVEAGAVGLNLEDTTAGGLLPISRFVAKIDAIRTVGEETGIPLVINARVDQFIAEIGKPDTRLEDAIERGRAYREAGADCVFVPAVTDADTIRALVDGIGGCVSILATRPDQRVDDLARLGVARISIGSGTYLAAMSEAKRFAEEILGSGTFTTFARRTVTHADGQRLLASHPPARTSDP
jgi:2-methylisocitrate lyase-like PEP mutase family enzyme